jgi:ElaA protein
MTWQVLEWEEITLDILHDIFSLRSEVFVVEQNCVYQDIDGKDPKATHVLGYIKNELVAYSRFFKPGIYFSQASFGRAVVKKKHRGKGYGHELVAYTLKAMGGNEEIKISAQQHLSSFYQSQGFVSKGAPYLEDGIPHIAMIKAPSKN